MFEAKSETGISVSLVGVDQTAGTFRSVAGRIRTLNLQTMSASAAVSALFRSAVPYLSAGFLARSIYQTCNALSALTDRAADAGASASHLKALEGAMRQIGVRGASIDTISAAFQQMAKRTGEVGVEGFAKVLGQASRLATEQERLTFLAEAFGQRQGAVFAAIAGGGEDAVRNLFAVAEGYPAISDAAAQAADRAADAMQKAGAAMSVAWGETVAILLTEFGDASAGIDANAQILATRLIKYAQIFAKAIHAAISGASGLVKTSVNGWQIIFEKFFRGALTKCYEIAYLTKALKDGAGGYTFEDAWRDTALIARDQKIDFETTVREASEDFLGWADRSDKIFRELLESLSGKFVPALSGGIKELVENAIGAGGVTIGKDRDKPERKNPWQFRGGNWAEENSAAARGILINGSLSAGRDAAAARADATVNSELPKVASAAERAADAAERQAAAAEESSQSLRDINAFLGDWEEI